jgi:hypothetical protein
LSKPEGKQRVPRSTFAYLQSRNRHKVYDLVIGLFEKSGLPQAALAKRLGKGTDQVCRLLGSPGNWELNTLSDLIFAINGGEVNYSVTFPLDAAPRNMTRPAWADSDQLSFQVLKQDAGKIEAAPTENFVTIKLDISSGS